MKLAGVISTAVLSLTLGVAAPAYAQQEQHEQQEEQKAKPAQDEKKAQPEKPAKQGEKRTQQDNKQQEKNAQQQDKNRQQQEKSAQQQEKNNRQQEKNSQQQDKNRQQEEKNAQQQQRTQQDKPVKQVQRGGGGRIPEDRYRAHFGREHSFRVSHDDYNRDRRFQYGGYWFGFVDPWPSNWLYTQDVFVVEIDGVYYLCNPMYPGVNITLSVTL
jgi:lipopolysaccharide export LptBFGC system permease protein LptF